MLTPNLFVRLTFTSPLSCHTHTKNYSERRLYIKYFFQHLILLKLLYQQHKAALVHFSYLRPSRFRVVTTKAPYRYKLTRNHYLRLTNQYLLFIKFFEFKLHKLSNNLNFLNYLTAQFNTLEFAYFNIKSIKLSLIVSHQLNS